MAKERFFNRGMLIFLAVGIANTLVGMGLMYLFDFFGWGYWPSSATAFVIGSALSFFLNKRFSFRNDDSVGSTLWRFALVIAACYLIAFSLARPLADRLLASWSAADADLRRRAAYLAGQILYTGLNYLGQRYFAFRRKTGA